MHSKLWRLCLKVKDCKLKSIWFNTWDTVLIHNFASEKGRLLDCLGLANEKIAEKKRKQELCTPSPTRKHQQQVEDDPDPETRAISGLHSMTPGAFWWLSFSLSEATVNCTTVSQEVPLCLMIPPSSALSG